MVFLVVRLIRKTKEVSLSLNSKAHQSRISLALRCLDISGAGDYGIIVSTQGPNNLSSL